MKKIYILGLVSLGIQFNGFSQITWDGGGTDNNWTTAANWSGDAVPSPSDNIIFNGTSSKNCDFDTDIQVASLSINSGYGGTIDALASLPIIVGDFSQAAGTFISSSDVTSGGLAIGGNINFTGGTFTHNGGVITMVVTDAAPSSITGAITFNRLDIQATGIGASQRNVDFGTSTTGTLNLAGGSRLYGYQGSINITSAFIIGGSATGNPTSNSGTFTFSGAGPITVTGAGAAARNKLPNIVVNSTGTLTMTGHLNVQGTWTGTQGIINPSTSTTNFYGTTSIIGAAAAFDNLILQTGSTVSFPASAEVKIARDFNSTSGTVNFPTSHTLSFNGTTTQNITGAFTIGNIHVYTGGGRTVNLNSAVNLIESITVDASTTFNPGSNLTLVSNSSGTARVATSFGTISGSGVKVETFIPGNFTGWTNMGVRGVHGQSILTWDTYTPPSAGSTGIPMTCVGCVNNPTVIGTGSNSFTSVQEWDEPSGSYVNIGSSYNFTPGKGIWAYVGDGSSNTADLKLVNTGSLVQGPLSIPLTSAGTGADAGFNLVANPYPSPISWDNTYGNNLDVEASIYVWNPDLAGGVGDYAVYNANTHISNPTGSSGIADVIAGGQGFYVQHSNLGFNAIDFDETSKINTSSVLLKPADNSNVPLFRLKLAGANDWDATVFCIHKDATSAYDRKFDARKIFHTAGYAGYPGSYNKYTTLSSKDNDNQDYSINTLPSLTNSVTIPILARVSASGSYTISAYDFKDFPMCVGLIDKLNNSYHDLRLSPYVVTISDTTSTPRFEMVLCKDVSLNSVGLSEITESSSIFINQDAQGAYVKTVFEKNTKATISVFNVIGQKLMNDVSVEGTVTTTQLPIDLHNQVVIIKVTTDKELVTKKIVMH